MLQEGEGDQHHQGVVVQPGPGPPLEVVEAEFFLHLLVRLLAGPAGLDRRREGLQRRAGGMAGEVVLPLAAAAPLAHQPQLIAGQAVAGLRLRTVGHPHPPGGEAGGERALGALPPADRAPGRSPQGGCGRDRPLVRDPMPARASRALCGGPAQLHRGGIDPLRLRDADRPERGAAGEAAPEGGAAAVAGVRQGAAEADPGRAEPVELGERDRPLAAEGAAFRGTPALAQRRRSRHQAWGR
jgi:hypothetical protein